MSIFRFILLNVFLFFWLIGNSQSTDFYIKENFSNYTFKEFQSIVSDKYNLEFYYQNNSIDTFHIVQNVQDTTVAAILKRTFTDIGINYYIDKTKAIFITKDYEISVSLPIYFYEVEDKKKITASTSSFLYEKKAAVKKQASSTIIIGDISKRTIEQNATLRGRIIDQSSGEVIIGAVVWSNNAKKGAATDVNGYFSIQLPKGRNSLEIRSVGSETISQDIVLNDDGILNFNLSEAVTQLADVQVMAEKLKNVEGLQMGLEKVSIQTISQLPTAMGEVDVLKVALMLPGVKSVGEGASGFNVRGGAVDQNLVLLDQSPLFNTTHLFGFFSVFNPDVINDFTLYKSAIPSKYGGRLSSVFDVSSINGNKREWHANLGFNPITCKLMVEGPIIKDKTSILLAGRTTYSDWILSKINNPAFKNSEASFFDWNAKIKHEINQKNFISLSIYSSSDYFKLRTDSTYNYYTINGTLQWKKIFSNNLYMNTYYVYSKYKNSISSRDNEVNAFISKYDIKYNELKTEVFYNPASRHKLTFGGGAILYNLQPGQIEPIKSSLVAKDKIQDEKSIEADIHLEDEILLTEKLSVLAGIRFSMFFVLGEREIYIYEENSPKSINTIIDTISYSDNQLIKTYKGPEWRVSSRYKITNNSSLKFSYNRFYQYIHMMSNTTSVSPTDIWKLSDYHIEPQKSDVFSLGFYRDLYKHIIEASVEVYYKKFDNILEFKGGAVLNNNHAIETELLNGEGKAYGVEVLFKKKHGYFNGWLAYTYSRSMIKVDGKFSEEQINGGTFYPTNYDKPHDFTLVLNNKFSRRFSISSTLTYSSGRPTTYPVAKYDIGGNEILLYSNRNEYRIPDYFRWDLSLNIESNLKKKKIFHSFWTLSCYNVTGRDNVYSIYFKEDENGEISGYKLSIFAKPIFTITYNVKI